MTASHWTHILTAAEIEERHALTERLDPRFAADERAFYASRTASQLESLATQAWNCCEGGAYQMARSYAALAEVSRVARMRDRLAGAVALTVGGEG